MFVQEMSTSEPALAGKLSCVSAFSKNTSDASGKCLTLLWNFIAKMDQPFSAAASLPGGALSQPVTENPGIILSRMLFRDTYFCSV